MTSFISIRDVNDKVMKSDKFIIINLFFDDALQDTSFIEVIIVEIHLIDDFVANLLLDNKTLISQKINVNLNNETIIIKTCQDIKIPIDVRTRENPNIKRIIKLR